MNDFSNSSASVIVPIYNTSKYLRKCLDSLSAQTLKDIEFVLVDDGSTDDCGRICNKYATTDSRFKVIYQRNGGSASARQTGLDAAKGDYVIVCDSDDWVEPDMYKKLYIKALETDADIVCCGYFAEYDDGRSVPMQTIFKENNGIVDNYDFISRGAGSSWVKLIKKSLFDKSRVSYEPGINMSEDSLIIYKLMKGNPKIVQIIENLYHYRRVLGGESYTNNVQMKHIHQLVFTYNWFKDNYKEDKFEPIRFQRAIDICFACLRTKDLNKNYLKYFLKAELPYSRILKNKKSLKSLIALAEKAISIGFARFFVKNLYNYIYK